MSHIDDLINELASKGVGLFKTLSELGTISRGNAFRQERTSWSLGDAMHSLRQDLHEVRDFGDRRPSRISLRTRLHGSVRRTQAT